MMCESAVLRGIVGGVLPASSTPNTEYIVSLTGGRCGLAETGGGTGGGFFSSSISISSPHTSSNYKQKREEGDTCQILPYIILA